jgi:hypothetical protein
MTCPRCHDRAVMLWAILFAHAVGGALYVFVRLHHFGVI